MIEFKEIPGYESLYSVSKCGQVLAHKKVRKIANGLTERVYDEKIMKQTIINGYKSVKLCKDGKIKCKGVHVLVALTYHQKSCENLVVNHKDCNKLNNNYLNLEWVTQKLNSEHASKNGMYKTLGENGRARIVLDTQTGIFYGCITEAANSRNISRSLLSHYLRGIVANKTSFIYP